MRTRTKTSTYHFWEPFDPENFQDLNNEYASYTTISYSSPEITSIKINWGWWTQWTYYMNDGWYTLTGSWHTERRNGETNNYNYWRKMITNYSIIIN